MNYKLVLIRHGESIWNKKNLFTGWSDVDLTNDGIKEAKEGGKILKEEGYDFDICYTSYLKRAIHTLDNVLTEMDRSWLPVIKSWKLNERHYGALQGLNKTQTAEKYGEEQVKIWRRSFDVLPPKINENDERNPIYHDMYKNIPKDALPRHESLETTIARVIPYYEVIIKKDIINGKRVLIAAHGNSIRALVKYFDNVDKNKIVDINIPTGIPLVYEFDENNNSVDHYYLGDKSIIKNKMNKVINQGKIKA